jgi:trimethylamine--corrinoid protein Co-methyltransferase
MQKDYVYPGIGNRMSPKEWNEAGKPDLVKQAAKKKDKILSTHFPQYIPEDIDDKIRANHNILLDRDLMRPGHKRFA